MSSPRVEYAYADGSANTARAVSVTYPDGSVLSYDYGAADGDDDRLSRVQKIADDGVNLVEYSYYGQANVLKTKYPAPNVTLDFASPAGVPYGGCLDRFGRVKQNPWVKGSGPIAGATYQYDRASNRTQMQPQGFTSTNAVERYSYDGLQRLTRSVRGSATTLKAQEAWGLDATGNWGKYDVLDVDTPAQNLAQQRTSNPANEITDVTETYGPVWPTPAYDRAGNTKSFPQPLTPTSSYSGTYDAWNRLVEVKQGSTVVATYQYDGLNRRVTQTSSGTTRHYYYSADWRVLEERTGTSTSADRQFFWGVRYVDDLVCRLTGTTRLYNCQDANWNTVAILDSSGAVQQRYRYSAYGTPTRLDVNGNVATGSDPLLWETLYAGYRYDRGTGLYQVRYRWLNPTMGNWVTRDPNGYNDGLNLYQLSRSCPILGNDPSGLFRISQPTLTSPAATNINPQYAPGFGANYVFTWEPGDPPQVVQQVEMSIYFEMHTDRGKYSLGVYVSYLEEWINLRATGATVNDTHILGHREPALSLAKALRAHFDNKTFLLNRLGLRYHNITRCNMVRKWTFNAVAAFSLTNGTSTDFEQRRRLLDSRLPVQNFGVTPRERSLIATEGVAVDSVDVSNIGPSLRAANIPISGLIPGARRFTSIEDWSAEWKEGDAAWTHKYSGGYK